MKNNFALPLLGTFCIHCLIYSRLTNELIFCIPSSTVQNRTSSNFFAASDRFCYEKSGVEGGLRSNHAQDPFVEIGSTPTLSLVT